jgi:peptidoglycan biosynthesis protein MviN/MurJ (putative lipid II flippase)
MTVAKALCAVLAAVLAGVLPGLIAGGPLGLVGWINVVLLALGAIQTYNAANLPGWPIAKTVAAVITAGGVVAVSALSDSNISPGEWIQIITALVGAIAVFSVPNQHVVPPAAAGPTAA